MEDEKKYIGTGFTEHSLDKAVSDVCDTLKCVLDNFCEKVLSDNCVIEESSSDNQICFVHYTSIKNLLNIINQTIKNKGDAKEVKDSYLRMHDSVHLNDPDEGDILTLECSRSYYHRSSP